MDRDVQEAFDEMTAKIDYSIDEMHRIEDQLPRGTSTTERVKDLLRRSGKALTPRQVTDELNQPQPPEVKVETIRTVLTGLHKKSGPIHRAGGGRYAWRKADGS